MKQCLWAFGQVRKLVSSRDINDHKRCTITCLLIWFAEYAGWHHIEKRRQVDSISLASRGKPLQSVRPTLNLHSAIKSFFPVSDRLQQLPNCHMSFSNMGICMCSSTRRITAPVRISSPAVLRSPEGLNSAVKRMLIDLKKLRTVPALCLEKNLLRKRRSEQHSEDLSRGSLHSPISLETQEQILHAPLLQAFVERCA